MTRTRPAPIVPLKPPRGTSGVVVFGGSFDPPHLWHTHIATVARRRLFGPRGLIVFIPAARSPLKRHGPAASDEDRLAMLRLATRRISRCVVWTDELERARIAAQPGPSYTIDTLARLRASLRSSAAPGTGDLPLRLLIGSDQAADFHRWREYRRVMKLAPPVVALRPPISRPAELRDALAKSGAWSADDLDLWMSSVLTTAAREHSSTQVRHLSADPRGAYGQDGPTRLVCRPVRDYIRSRNLYRLQPVRSS
ncbi:MAG: nicotinate-nicotinamide nucleotide adenylyltransferase [Phycisphaerales bacterium]